MRDVDGGNSDYEGFDEADLAHHIASLITQLTGRLWDITANERLATWLVDSVNRSTAVHWLVYVGEGNNPPIDPMEEFALRMPMEEALSGDRDAEPAGFQRRERRWWLPRR